MALLMVVSGVGCATSARTKAWQSDIQRGDDAMQRHDLKTARDAYSAAVDKAGAFGSQKPELAQSLDRLASVSFADHQYLEAKTLCERVIALEQKRVGATNISMADHYVRLAEVEETMKLYEDADRLYQKASDLVESDSGISTPVLGVYLARRARLYNKMELYEHASILYEKAIKFIEDAQFNLSFSPQLAEERSEFLVESARARNEYGLLCLKLGKTEDAERLFIRACDTLEARYSKDAPPLAPVLLNLAKAFKQEGNLEAAENAARKSLGIALKTMDSTNPIVIEIREFIHSVVQLEEEQEAAKKAQKAGKVEKK
jgi:tetratricopeptide (TPR) repeat protein